MITAKKVGKMAQCETVAYRAISLLTLAFHLFVSSIYLSRWLNKHRLQSINEHAFDNQRPDETALKARNKLTGNA